MRAYSVCKYYSRLIQLLVLLLSSTALLAQEEKLLRDPTTPLGHKVIAGKTNAAASEYELNSVLISSQRKLAVINGQTLREGQEIPGSAGVHIKSISAQRVVLQQVNKRWELSLTPTTIRKH